MAALNLPDVPTPLKTIQHYLKTATEHDQRDPVISYWCRLHALQTGLKLSTKTTEETGFLLKLMDWLEVAKKSHHDNEAITNEVAAQAHLENYALKLFMFADKNDRAANFGKNVVKAFYTAGIIYDVLTTFGELSEEAAQNKKYAKWKAAYIHNCLKNGETPVPGPMREEGDDESNVDEDSGPPGNIPSTSGLADENEVTEPEPPQSDSESAEQPNDEPQPALEDGTDNEVSEPGGEAEPEPESKPAVDDMEENGGGFVQPTPPPSTDAFGFPSVPGNPTPPARPSQTNLPYPPNNPGFNNSPVNPNPYNPAPTPTNLPPRQPSFDATEYNTVPKTEGGVTLDMEQMTKAQKYVKWASSALNYDDVPTAVLNLRKALHLLTTGQDPA